MNFANVKTWIVTDGGAGFEAQALGIAEALGAHAEIKRVKQSAPWRWLAPWGPVVQAGDVGAPWPGLVIASGRQAIPFARMIKRRAPRTFVAVLQDPRVPPSWFDFVWVPEHDRLRGPNVMTTLVSPHRVTPERLADEAVRIAPEIAHLPEPRFAVLLGGTNADFSFDGCAAIKLGDELAAMAKRYGAGLMVTASRRTGAVQAEIVRDRIKSVPAVMWTGEGHNPYFGFLGSADSIFVTCDSVNMIGEAASTGIPIYILELEGGAPKRDRFLGAMYAAGAARPFRGDIETWSYTPLDATADIAAAIARAMESKNGV